MFKGLAWTCMYVQCTYYMSYSFMNIYLKKSRIFGRIPVPSFRQNQYPVNPLFIKITGQTKVPTVNAILIIIKK